jgi:hypothetical protein
MDKLKKDLLDYTNEIKKDVFEIRNAIRKKENDNEKIGNIIKVLNQLKKTDIEFIESIKVIEKSLSQNEANVNKLSYDILSENAEVLFMLIDKNLLYGLRLDQNYNDNLVRFIINGDTIYGSITIVEDDKKQTIADININNFVYSIQVDHYYTIYPIVTYINTNYNYSQDKNKIK